MASVMHNCVSAGDVDIKMEVKVEEEPGESEEIFVDENVIERRLRATPEQFAVLLEFMERHGDPSKLKPSPQSRIRGDQLWSQLTSLLNSVHCGVEKSSDKWKKVWADWKAKTKKKYLSIRQNANSFGSSRLYLTALEERVIAIIGATAGAARADIQEQVYNRTTTSVQEEVYEIISEVPQSQDSSVDPLAVTTPAQSPLRSQVSSPLLVKEKAATLPPSPQTPTYQRSQIRSQPTIRQQSPSRSATTSRRLLKARRNRGLTPFERAASEFVAVEQRRLELEEARDRRLHEREMERLRLESQRIEVGREHNRLLHQLSVLGQSLVDTLTRQRLLNGVASTDLFPDLNNR